MNQEGQFCQVKTTQLETGENTANSKSSYVVPYLVHSHFRTSHRPGFDCLQCTKMEGKIIYHVMTS